MFRENANKTTVFLATFLLLGGVLFFYAIATRRQRLGENLPARVPPEQQERNNDPQAPGAAGRAPSNSEGLPAGSGSHAGDPRWQTGTPASPGVISIDLLSPNSLTAEEEACLVQSLLVDPPPPEMSIAKLSGAGQVSTADMLITWLQNHPDFETEGVQALCGIYGRTRAATIREFLLGRFDGLKRPSRVCLLLSYPVEDELTECLKRAISDENEHVRSTALFRIKESRSLTMALYSELKSRVGVETDSTACVYLREALADK